MTLLPVVRRRFGWTIVVAGLAAVLACPLVWADPAGPRQEDRHIAVAVSTLLRREHLTKHAIDDEISERSEKSFLKMLDPWKLYFYQSDIDAFDKYKDELDDMAKKGDVSFAYLVFKTFLQRIDERVQMVDELLGTKLDFTADEDMTVDKEKVTWAKTPAEARERWRKRLKYDLLTLKADKADKSEKTDKNGNGNGKEEEDPIEKLKKRYRSFGKRMHQTDSEELLEMYLTSFTSSFDPHTSYMSPSTVENFTIAMKLELEGIGAALQSIDGYTVVNKIVPGGAAEKDGRLKVEDKIVAVGKGDEGEMVDIIDMKLSEVVKMIRGKEGTPVRLAVVSVGSPEKKIYKLTRAKIELKDSEARAKIFDAGRKPDGAAFKVGVIDLPSFYMDMDGARRGLPDFKSTTRDVKVILEDFNKKGVDAVVLDLRRNGGGSLTEAINLTGLFISEGPVVQVKDADGRTQPYFDLEPATVWAGPLVVLTSKFSASASEILAGAIQDYGRGLIVGDHATHGKGTVQSLLDLSQQLFRVPNAPSMGSLKITMQQFYRPSGESTQRRGVLADIELPSLTTHLDVGEADLDYPLPFDKIDALRYKNYGYVTQAICDQLRRLSDQRCSQSDKFQLVRKGITRYLEQKARKTVTLNEEKFLKERAEMNADKEEEKKIDELNNSQNTIERDFYLDEVLAIAVDYLNLRQVAKAN